MKSLVVHPVMKWLFVGLWALLLISCVYQRFPGVADPSVRIRNVSGVSVLPPQEQGWMIAQMSLYQLALLKQGSPPDATYAANIEIFQLPKLESEEAFFQHVSKGRSAEPATGRFVIIKNDEEIFRGREAYCIKYHSLSKDKGAKTPSGTKIMLMESIGYCCRHPKNKTVGVDFVYSHRHHAGDDDADFPRKADAFLDQVRFTDF
jgi:hypothetical protein